MFEHAAKLYQATLDEIVLAGLHKEERVLTTPQGPHVRTDEVAGRGDVLNFCSNNYLGLAAHPRLIEASKRSLDTYGFGLSSVPFIFGTQPVHQAPERQLFTFLGPDDTTLYSSCFDVYR